MTPSKEPALWAGAVRAMLCVGVAFGLKVTPEQLGMIYLAVEAVTTLFVRQTVTPNAKAPKDQVPTITRVAALEPPEPFPPPPSKPPRGAA